MVEIGGIELSDVEAQQLKRLLDEERARRSEEEIIELGGTALVSDEDPREWARQIIRDLDEKLP